MATMECILTKQNKDSKNTVDEKGIQLVDISTGKKYRLVVESAILKLEEIEKEDYVS